MESIKHLKALALNLDEIDLSIIERDFSAINILTSEEQYSQLSILCQNKAIIHPQWLLLAGRIKMKSLKNKIAAKFSDATRQLHQIANEEYVNFVMSNTSELDYMIDPEKDYNYNIFAVETLLKSYLARLKKDDETFLIETPQYMYLRVATFLWFPKDKKCDVDTALTRIQKTYNDLSDGNYSHASPTLFNAGLFRPQMASCFTLNINDSIQSLTKSWHDCAIISMNSGGIGIDFSSLRHSEIGQYGTSKGIVPWIKIADQLLCAVDQGGKRKGSGTAYLCDWHIDIEEFIDLRKSSGPENMRARNMFYALWISDEFMRRVEKDEEWTLFCPNKAKGLDNKWGIDFEMTYRTYEKKAQDSKLTHFRKIKARDLWKKIILAQIETGMPFMLYKDACNRKSNQKNLGTIRLSNLCTEILLYTDKSNIGSCNLGSIALNSCVGGGSTPFFDFEKLEQLTADLVRNINQVIDRNFYPPEIPQIKDTNLRNRPLGIGVQGLADTFAMLNLSWIEPEAKQLNIMIFETMYYAAVKESIEMAKECGSYETFKGSPASNGYFQFDLWDLEKMEKDCESSISIDFLQTHVKRRGPDTDRYDWDSLRKDMIKFGLYNSLLLALMPTASTSNILGNNETFEPYTQQIYTRTVLSGQFVVINPHLVKDLQAINMWTTDVVRHIWVNRGSIANLPDDNIKENIRHRVRFLKEKYLTAFEIPQKKLLELSLDRARYICQTQSFNCWMNEPTYTKLNAFHFFGWKGGAKTGMYYLRQNARMDPINFSLDGINIPPRQNIGQEEGKEGLRLRQRQRQVSGKGEDWVGCTDEICEACSS
uniref:Ribonucleoside-diphosphate reductase n=1 Tax=Marseillevirus LCMAC102 TaxID=2506603 RepID=A0A481YTF9_9VIRU|nr:MAG: ribonucleoside diphosphate reductase, large subunit [Marseillevirus LCMAC102]